MPYRILLAASPSFNDADLFQHKVKAITCNRPNVEFHVLTQKVFTKMVNQYVIEYNKTHGYVCLHEDCQSVIYQRDFFNDGPQTTMILYNQILDIADAVIVFWDGETSNEKRLIELCQEHYKPYRVVTYESLKQLLKRSIAEAKREKRTKVTVNLSNEAKARYFAAHEQWFANQYPTAYLDNHYAKPKINPINSGSRMDTFIVNFLVWSGWSATIVRASGRQVKGKWIPGGTKKGTFDITATIKGRSVKIETKHGSDTPKKDQLKMQERERKAGAIAEIVYSIEEFFILYDKIINND